MGSQGQQVRLKHGVSCTVEQNVFEERAAIEKGHRSCRKATRGAEDRGCKGHLLPDGSWIHVRNERRVRRHSLFAKKIRGHSSEDWTTGPHNRGGFFSVGSSSVQDVGAKRE